MTTLTIRIPDELRELGERFARMLESMPPEAVRAYLEDLEDDAWCAAQARQAEAEIASGETTLLDWEDVDAQLDALPD
ncbi:MAG: hypothetical protein GX774_01670 [Armatimonadetes bacterium]|jgi:predicted transcriptional regulator|nr:hypothetical protein [Armatimonadota bacterium]